MNAARAGLAGFLAPLGHKLMPPSCFFIGSAVAASGLLVLGTRHALHHKHSFEHVFPSDTPSGRAVALVLAVSIFGAMVVGLAVRAGCGRADRDALLEMIEICSAGGLRVAG